jgi:hypothetical protein
MPTVENTNPTAQIFGSAPINTVINTVVATLPITVPGTYKVWGVIRHTLIDGLKIVAPTALAMQLTSAANDTAAFGPMVASFPTAGAVTIQLATATGAADTASAFIVAQRM